MAVVGGGFGGLAAVRALARAPVRVTLVDRRGRHVFQPLLYRVALGDLGPAEVEAPLAEMLRGQRNVAVRVDEVVSVDAGAGRLVLRGGELGFDALVLAAGGSPTYFGHDGWRALAPALHSVDDALEIRSRVRGALVAASAEADPVRRAAWLTFVVVGGGPTGVELAGGLAELVGGLPAGHPGRAARVLLLERSERVLPSYPEPVGRRAATLLDRAGVEVRTRAAAAGLDGQGVRLPGERISARTVLWAAGIGGAALSQAVGAPLDGSGRLEVRPDLSLPGCARVFAVGDAATIAWGEGRVPGTAQAAAQAGRHAAQNALRALAGEPTVPFRCASASRLAAV
ncbi:MAG TPA: FAD-dependent oxidoreductase, partial [Anaeromyxobacteraceae bacterium]|nr:FAD-dependent oxidoreductase [Anaeromyxobacteraceae bacterium]